MSRHADTRVTSLYVCYWSLTDPLCQTQSLAYLRQLAAEGHRFALMTFEQDRFRLAPAEARAMRRELAAEGIHWYPLAYHKRYPLLATAYDCARGVAVGAFAALRHRARIVHSRASIPAAIEGTAFKVTAWVEREARRRADAVVVLSEVLRGDFVDELGVRAPVTVIPCCVDTAKFRFDPEARAARRRELGVGDERLFVYVGKLGPRYLVDEAFAFFGAARERLGPTRLLVLTGDPEEGFRRIADRHGVAPADLSVRSSPPGDVPAWLAAADAGLAFIRGAGCERGSSPVKIGEYLSVGLPVVITAGIGDYSDLIERERLGVVVRDLSAGGYARAAARLGELWAEGQALGRRCRAAASAHVALDTIGAVRYHTVYRSMLGPEGPLAARERRTEP
jgi:glycosyltransferase involved in cell wall biosynthesis